MRTIGIFEAMCEMLRYMVLYLSDVISLMIK